MGIEKVSEQKQNETQKGIFCFVLRYFCYHKNVKRDRKVWTSIQVFIQQIFAKHLYV